LIDVPFWPLERGLKTARLGRYILSNHVGSFIDLTCRGTIPKGMGKHRKGDRRVR